MSGLKVRAVVDVSYPHAPTRLSGRLQERIRDRHQENLLRLMSLVTNEDGISRVQITPLETREDCVEFKVILDVTGRSWNETRHNARSAVIRSLGSSGADYQINGIQQTPR